MHWAKNQMSSLCILASLAPLSPIFCTPTGLGAQLLIIIQWFIDFILKFVLVLHVATATVERCFSAMKIVKTHLRNHIGDKIISNSLICYVEKEEMLKVTNETVRSSLYENARS